MGKKENQVSIHKNGVIVRSKNRRTVIVETHPDIEFHAANILTFVGLTSNTGPLAGARSDVSSNGKIKTTSLGFSDQGIVDLYIALKTYLNK
jgi:hypothetical protein